MPFQGPNFVRTQNFTRDRNAGPPDDTIQAEKVDDEFANVASGLTTVALAAATADDRARTAQAAAENLSAAAQTAAISTVRGGVDAAYDTLSKLYAWAKAQTDDLRALVGRASPAGQLGMFFTPTAPAGWLHANGAAVSRADYPALFLAIGTRYGTGNGSTTFNLPDCRDEFFRGAGATAVGDKGAQSIQSHTHGASAQAAGHHNHGGSTSDSGAHTHVGTTDVQGSHTHGISTNDNQAAGRSGVRAGNTGPQGVSQAAEPAGEHAHNLQISGVGNHIHGIFGDGQHTHTLTIDPTGSAETRPRFMAVLVCIKV